MYKVKLKSILQKHLSINLSTITFPEFISHWLEANWQNLEKFYFEFYKDNYGYVEYNFHF